MAISIESVCSCIPMPSLRLRMGIQHRLRSSRIENGVVSSQNRPVPNSFNRTLPHLQQRAEIIQVPKPVSTSITVRPISGFLQVS